MTNAIDSMLRANALEVLTLGRSNTRPDVTKQEQLQLVTSQFTAPCSQFVRPSEEDIEAQRRAARYGLHDGGIQKRSKNGTLSALRLMRASPHASWVYFVRCGSYVKIGHGADPTRRLRDFEAGNPYPLRLIGMFPGGKLEERRLHEAFERLRHATAGEEWFKLGAPLLDEIKRLSWLRVPGLRLRVRTNGIRHPRCRTSFAV